MIKLDSTFIISREQINDKLTTVCSSWSKDQIFIHIRDIITAFNIMYKKGYTVKELELYALENDIEIVRLKTVAEGNYLFNSHLAYSLLQHTAIKVLIEFIKEKEVLYNITSNIKTPKEMFEYIKHNIKGAYPEGESVIASSASCSYYYSTEILNYTPFSLGEKAISESAEYSYYYSIEILGGRFELGEPAIAKDPVFSSLYAINIIKGRWELAEEIINSEPNSAKAYMHFLEEKNIKSKQHE